MAQTHRGALLVIAKRLNITIDQYMEYHNDGWRHCYKCWHWKKEGEFCKDRTRWDGCERICSDCRKERYKATYIPQGRKRRGFLVPARPDDKKQARRRINYLVEQGLLDPPNQLPCVDCGHIYSDGERRHEYDHFKGYGAEHQLDVEVCCTTCHMQRTMTRGEWKPWQISKRASVGVTLHGAP